MELDDFLGRLEKVSGNGDGQYKACCPAHDDQSPSMSVKATDDGTILVNCFAGCSTDEIVAALGLTTADLFAGRGRGGRRVTGSASPASGPGLTLEQYAEDKMVPVEFLRELGLRDHKIDGKPVVRIPFRDEDGAELTVKYRHGGDGGGPRFTFKSGTKARPYGLERLAEARAADYVILVEGESDGQTLWSHGEPALGLPGANSWKEEFAHYLDGIAVIYVVVEPDQGGEAMVKRIAKSSIAPRVRLIRMTPECKDPSALHLDGPDGFEAAWGALKAAAVPWAEVVEGERTQAAKEAFADCEDLASEPDILACFLDSLSARGVVGEKITALIIFLVLTSRLLAKPVSLAIKGPSSGGKSFVLDEVLAHFPTSASYMLSAMSERALAYSNEPLEHRVLILCEAAGLNSDFQSYLVRSLLSEGFIKYETVEKTSEGLVPRLIERKGPTGLVVTTTLVGLHPENETRMLSVTVTDTRKQTAAVMCAIAGQKSGDAAELRKWAALQQWLEGNVAEVEIPYAVRLAQLIPPLAVRLRRDFKALLGLISAHALLHPLTRARDGDGRVIATLADYSAVRELIAELFANAVEAGVSAQVRAAVAAVDEVHLRTGKAATYKQVSEKLDLDLSAARRRCQQAIKAGYLRNHETRRGQPAKLAVADVLPADIEMLPAPELLGDGAMARGSGGMTTATVTGETVTETPVAAESFPFDGPAGWAEEL
jgi:hypothetical protein